MITVHHLENSRSQRVIWLLEELGVEYTVKRYSRDPSTRLAPPELKAIHPLGKSPVITDGERTVAETGFIIEYLIDHYGNGKLQPKVGTEEYFRYRYWLHAGEGSTMPPLVMFIIYAATTRAPVPFFIRPITRLIFEKIKAGYLLPTIKGNLQLMEDELNKSTWFAGEELTGADILLLFAIEAASVRVGLDEYPKLKAFVERVYARPAYQKALEAGGPFAILS